MPRSETPLRSDLFPGDLALRQRHAGRRRAAHDLLGAERQSRRRAGRVPAWRAGRRLGAGASPLLRPAILSHRRVRPARLRPLDAARRAAGQHHRPSRGRHGKTAHASRHPAVAAVRRLVGQHPGAGLWLETSRARDRLHPARHLPRRALGDRLVPSRHARDLPRGVARLRRASAGRRARRSSGQLLSPPHRPQSRPPSPGGARLEPLRGGLLDALSDGARALRIRSRRLRLGPVAHRGALLRQRHLRARGLAVARPRPHPPSVEHHRAGPLRHRLPAGDGRRAVAGLARGALRRRARCRPQRARARHSRRPGERHRELQAVEQRRRPVRARAFPGKPEPHVVRAPAGADRRRRLVRAGDVRARRLADAAQRRRDRRGRDGGQGTGRAPGRHRRDHGPRLPAADAWPQAQGARAR